MTQPIIALTAAKAGDMVCDVIQDQSGRNPITLRQCCITGGSNAAGPGSICLLTRTRSRIHKKSRRAGVEFWKSCKRVRNPHPC